MRAAINAQALNSQKFYWKVANQKIFAFVLKRFGSTKTHPIICVSPVDVCKLGIYRMTKSEAELALNLAEDALAKTQKRTIARIVSEHSEIYKLGFSQGRSVAVMACAIQLKSRCAQKLNSIEKALRSLPEYKKQRRKSNRRRAGRAVVGLEHRSRPTTAPAIDLSPTVAPSDTGCVRYQSDERNLNRNGWN